MQDGTCGIMGRFFRGATKKKSFRYTARNGDGSPMEGTVDAESAAAAANQLLDMGAHPVELHRDKRRGESYPVYDESEEGLITRWRLAWEDGQEAVWKPSRSGRLFGAMTTCFGLAVLAAVWLLWTGGPGGQITLAGWVLVIEKSYWWIGKIVVTLIALLFLGAGLSGLFMVGELRVRRSPARLEFRIAGWRSFVCEQTSEIVAERRYHRFTSGVESVSSYLALVPTVRVISKDGSIEELEQCGSAKHATELAAKVAEYLNVPCRNTL